MTKPPDRGRGKYIARTRLIRLDCNHDVELPIPIPDVGALQWCQRCADYTRVYDVKVMFRTRCKPTCRTGSRGHGVDEATAYKFAKKHVSQNPTHLVEIFRDGDKIMEVRNTEDSLFSTHADIREIAEWNQQILRQAERHPLSGETFDAGNRHTEVIFPF